MGNSQRGFYGLEPAGGVPLGADEVIAAFCDNTAQGGFFVVEQIGSIEGVREIDVLGGERGAGFTDFEVIHFPGGRNHDDGPTVFVGAQGDVHETLEHERTVAVLPESFGGQLAQDEAEKLAGDIGAAGHFREEESPELDAELKAERFSSHRVPGIDWDIRGR